MMHNIAFFLPIFLLCLSARAQTIAVLVPESKAPSPISASTIESRLTGASLKVLDADLVRAAYASARPELPFNMTTAEAKRLGSAIGCNFIVLVKAADLRRSSLERSDYRESYAAIYLISSRTGNLLYWTLETAEADSAEAAKTKLSERLDEIAGQLTNEILAAKRLEGNTTSMPRLSAPEDFAGRKSFRAPIPYDRIKPEYTRIAYLYGTEGTVDIEVDIDEMGVVTNSDVTRWLGFGLDESVEKAVRAMNWRPAELDGKPLAMRVLLRYNFKKIEKD